MLEQLKYELEKFKAENTSLRQENCRLKHSAFDITKYKSDRDIAFCAGFPNWDIFMLCFNTIKDSGSGIIDGRNEIKRREENIVGRPRSLLKLEEFTLVMM